jgi:hypothetical protein
VTSPVDIIRGFLTPMELRELQEIAADDRMLDWAPGRQGTGYLKADLKTLLAARVLTRRPIHKALEQIGQVDGGHWDAWLLRYPSGSHVPPHKDKPEFFGLRHRRLNAVVQEALYGGHFTADGVQYDLSERDAILFWPDEVTHSVSEVGGDRYIFSVGALVQP